MREAGETVCQGKLFLRERRSQRGDIVGPGRGCVESLAGAVAKERPLSRPKAELEAEAIGRRSDHAASAGVYTTQVVVGAERGSVCEVVVAADGAEHDVMVVQIPVGAAAWHRAAPAVAREHAVLAAVERERAAGAVIRPMFNPRPVRA